MKYLLEKLRFKLRFISTGYFRNFLVELIWAKTKEKYSGMLFSAFWSVLKPLLFAIVIYLIFKNRFACNIKGYPLYVLIGVVSINFFITSTISALMTLSDNKESLLNLTMPREPLFIAFVFPLVIELIVGLIFCAGLAFLSNVFKIWSFLLLLPIFVSYIAFVFGTNMILAVANCWFRDIEYLWLTSVSFLFFFTPVFYDLESVSPVMQKVIYWANPLVPFLISFQNILIEPGQIDIAIYAHGLVSGFTVFILGYFIFMIFENSSIEKI